MLTAVWLLKESAPSSIWARLARLFAVVHITSPTDDAVADDDADEETSLHFLTREQTTSPTNEDGDAVAAVITQRQRWPLTTSILINNGALQKSYPWRMASFGR